MTPISMKSHDITKDIAIEDDRSMTCARKSIQLLLMRSLNPTT